MVTVPSSPGSIRRRTRLVFACVACLVLVGVTVWAIWEGTIDRDTMARFKRCGELVAKMRTEDARGKIRIMEELSTMGSDAKLAVPDLIAALRADDPGIRQAAARTLGSFFHDCTYDNIGRLREWKPDPVDVTAIHALIVALRDDDSNVRAAAAKSLGSLGPHSRGAETALTHALATDPAAEVRDNAASSVGSTRRPGRQAVLALLRALLRDKDEEVRSSAGSALLICTGSDALREEDVPALVKALRSRDCWARQCSAMLLSRLGPQARPAVPALIAALNDNVYVRRPACIALGRARSETAVPALVGILADDGDIYVQMAAARALGEIGSKEAIPGLTAALKNAHPHVRDDIADAIKKIRRARPAPGVAPGNNQGD